MSNDEPSIDPHLVPEIAHALEQTQIGKYHTRGGHGFAAEDANALVDRLWGRCVDQIGTNNARNGADRVVNGLAIQTKYHHKARLTIGDAFSTGTGLYRYDGQLLEVPSDQYEECLAIMRDRIAGGNVPGIVDPNDAGNVVRRGDITYKQARNLARAGNIDSITFDAKSQAIICTYVFAISFAVHFAKSKWKGDRTDEAVIRAIESGVFAGSATLITGVIAAQVLRLRAAAFGAVTVRSGMRVLASTTAGRKAIESVAHASLGKAVYGGAAVNHVAKLLRSNLIVATVAVAVTSVPDFYRAAILRSISWQQFTKNLTVSAAGVGAGMAGWMAGAGAGAALGTAVPFLGTIVGALIGGIVGAVAGGILGSTGAKATLDVVVDDDAKQLLRILETVVAELAADYLLSEAEIEQLLAVVNIKANDDWLRSMYQAEGFGSSNDGRSAFAYQAFDGDCLEIIKRRSRIELPLPEEVEIAINHVAAAVLGTETVPDEAPKESQRPSGDTANCNGP